MRVTVGDGHLYEASSPHHRAVIELDVVKDQSFAVVETNAERPPLPRNNGAIYRERRAVRLDNLEGLGRVVSPLGGEVVVAGDLIPVVIDGGLGHLGGGNLCVAAARKSKILTDTFRGRFFS